MTRDDIMQLIDEVELYVRTHSSGMHIYTSYDISKMKRFAELVAEREREACALVCERLPETFKIAADEFGYKAETPTAENYAAAIRARGEQEETR